MLKRIIVNNKFIQAYSENFNKSGCCGVVFELFFGVGGRGFVGWERRQPAGKVERNRRGRSGVVSGAKRSCQRNVAPEV